MTHHNLPQLQIIGLTGAAGSGKDTVADILVTHLGFVKIAFADALRDEVCEAFDINPLSLTHRKSKEANTDKLQLRKCKDLDFSNTVRPFSQFKYASELDAENRSPRQIMQWWGTEYRRAQDAFYWTKKLQEKIKLLVKTHQRIVVSDVRFDNESHALSQQNLQIDNTQINQQIWHVMRGQLLPEGKLSHSSEQGIARAQIDRHIYNDNSITDLVGPVLLQWLTMESNQTLRLISSSANMIDGWHYE